jgi:hypothetical protein
MGKHTPADKRRQLVARWRDSDLSMSAFACLHRVRPGTFASWVSRARGPNVSSPAFVQVSTMPVAVSLPRLLVVVGDHELRFEAPPPPAWFAAVVRELAPC